MGIDDAWKSRIEDILLDINKELGGIKMFMEQSKLERNILFNKCSENTFEVQEIKAKGCGHLPAHIEIAEVVKKHEQTYQQGSGIMWIVGVGTPVLSAFLSWLASNWHKLNAK